MARIEDSYPTPIHGVSTLAPRNRAEGTAGLQENMRSDPVSKLTRRPSLQWDYALEVDGHELVAHHGYYRDGKEVDLVVTVDPAVPTIGHVWPYSNGVLGNTNVISVDTQNYLASDNLQLTTLNGATTFINTDVVVELDSATDENTVQKVVHINILNALSYTTTLQLVIEDGGGADLGIYDYTIFDGGSGNVIAADEQRATNNVATNLAHMINNGLEQDGTVSLFYPPAADFGMIAKSKGSSLSIQRLDNAIFPNTFITTGRTDDVAHLPEIIDSPDGLPKFGIVGTRLTIQPDPTREAGTYFLEAESVTGQVTTAMTEVVWVETRDPRQPYKFDETTIPLVLTEDEGGIFDFVFSRGWEERQSGNDKSCPPPNFVGKKLTAVGQFQKRLVLVAGNTVSMSKTDQQEDWWKTSALTLLATDPVELESNAPDTDMIRYIVEHNRDLLLVASNAQFKIDGTTGITPQTAALPLTTTYEVQITTEPVSVGSAVYLPITYGSSTGVTQYSGGRDQQDKATAITHHVVGYMMGEAALFAGSANLEMLAMTTTGGASNELFIYDYYTEGGENRQRSWSLWALPDNEAIVALKFRGDRLTILTQGEVGGVLTLFSKSIQMYSPVGVNTHEVYLDNLLVLPTDGLTATLPTEYATPNMIVVLGEGTVYPLEQVDYTLDGSTVTFSEDIGAGSVYVGSQYSSKYQPTRPYVKDNKGVAVTSDRLRIGKFILNVVDTESIKMHIDSPYYDMLDQELSPRILGGLTNRLGVIDMYTGDYKFSYSQDADLATATFYTDGYLGMTVSGISWEGQYNRTSGRL
ncbi:MAG: hypothetical protein V7745_07085 [Pseudomonadales bacterium]